MTAPPKISTRARAYLRSLAHHLEPLSQIGHDGLTEGLIESISTLLDRHELIKVRVGQGYEGDRREAAAALAGALGADLTQMIGRIIVLYRPRPPAKKADKGKDAKRPPIVLPE